jgi:hypothetical protein
MGKRVLVFLALFFSVGLLANAQDVKAADGVKIDLSGRAEIDYVYRSPEVQEALGISTKSADFFQHRIEIGFKTKLVEKVHVYAEIGNKRIDNDASWGDYLLEPLLRQAYLEVEEFFLPNLKLTLGLQDFIVNDFFFNLRLSEPAWGAEAGQKLLCDPIGLSLGYVQNPGQENPGVTVNAFWAVVREGGASGDDEKVAAVHLKVPLPASVGAKGTGIDGVLANCTGSGKDEAIWTFGIGANFVNPFNVEGLEFGLEGYFQTGDAGRDALGNTLDAKGRAFRFGGKYSFPKVEAKPWVELSYWWLSGDGDAADTDAEAFVSYEGNNQFLLIENNYFGLDVDTNYNAIKLGAGASHKIPGTEHVLDFSLLVGLFTLDEKIGTYDDKLGNEIDLAVSLKYSKDLNLYVAFAFLTGSKYLEDTIGEDSAQAFALGANVKF